MKARDKEILEQFQCEFIRSIEENFAQVLTEEEKVRVFFINENVCFTDGQNIVVDPAFYQIFCDSEVLRETERYLNLQMIGAKNRGLALKMITRTLVIHESLHILYSDFSGNKNDDPRKTTKIRRAVVGLINNIIEDAFIEAVGCSVYDNMELYLKYLRVAIYFSCCKSEPGEGTGKGEEARKAKTPEEKKLKILDAYFQYMTDYILYPFGEQKKPEKGIAAYVKKTKQLYLDGSVCGQPNMRYSYVQKIFDVIEPLIPDEGEMQDKDLAKKLYGTNTHTGGNNTIRNIERKGREVCVTRRLFTDKEGNSIPNTDFSNQREIIIADGKKEIDNILQTVNVQTSVVNWQGGQFDCTKIHKDIQLIQTKPKPNLDFRKAYQNILHKYQININSYNSRFSELLKTKTPVREEKKLFGAGVDSHRLYDVKKRYWYNNAEEYGLPDIAVMLLIDGSGSMLGERRSGAIIASVILHEVLKKQGIAHAIVEHRAINGERTVHHNILVDFAAREDERYNILSLQAYEGTREGLSLFWAEKYINSKTANEKRLIIVLSDGLPIHRIAGVGDYTVPVSIMDTQNAVTKIIKRGMNLIAVALDSEDNSCYEQLKGIYPYVVACTDLKQLTGQLLGLISKLLH